MSKEHSINNGTITTPYQPHTHDLSTAEAFPTNNDSCISDIVAQTCPNPCMNNEAAPPQQQVTDCLTYFCRQNLAAGCAGCAVLCCLVACTMEQEAWNDCQQGNYCGAYWHRQVAQDAANCSAYCCISSATLLSGDSAKTCGGKIGTILGTGTGLYAIANVLPPVAAATAQAIQR